MTPQEHYARLVAVAYTAPVFAGRAKLLQLASKIGEPIGESALVVLEMTPQEQEIAALRGTMHPKVMRILKLHQAERILEADRIRRLRASSGHYQGGYWRIQDPDLLLERSPGEALKRFTLERFEQARRKLHPRHASHGHEDVIVFVPLGQENVVSKSEYVPPEHAGLPRNYRYWVVQSKHFWYVSPAILRVPLEEQSRNALYLAPNVRVRQGKAFNLVVERAPMPPLRERRYGSSRRHRRW